MPDRSSDLLAHLIELYGDPAGRATYERLRELLEKHKASPPPRLRRPSAAVGARHAVPGPAEGTGVTQRDSILITYGDQLREPDHPPLQALADFCNRHLAGAVGGIHVLPFYPYSSDDGFSVIDYRRVDPALGSWEDIHRLGERFRLMFDAVVNHVSAQSEWFRAFLRDDPRYRDYFIAVAEGTDVSKVVRPRALPLLTKFRTAAGEKWVWTTFSEDQVDLNFRHPEVLLEIVDTLLFYAAHGAEFIRLDAIAYLWKELGTACIHLPQTHRVVQLFRAVLDEVAPHVLLITETNVPHADNVSYFGDGRNEAQMVYNFALPPLTLHAFHTGSARVLSEWAAGLTLPSDRVTFFNFLASHDGIGVNPARGILPEREIDALVERVRAHGGRVSYKFNPDGTQSPYELNVNYFDALSDSKASEPIETQVDRFIASQAIMLSLAGVPGIYFHSLFGSRGWPEGVARTGRNRTINRQKLDRADLERELADPASLRHRIFSRYAQLLRLRAAKPAFHPHGAQQVLDCGDSIFAVLRVSPDGRERALCLHNVSDQPQPAQLPFPPSRLSDLGLPNATPHGPATLAPYQVLWLRVE